MLSLNKASRRVESDESTTDGSTALERIMLPDAFGQQYGARCLDGSPYGYYIRRSKTNSTKWVFAMEGGGLCVEPVDCLQRKKTSLGSSTGWGATWGVGTDGMQDVLSDNATINPHFYDFNHVYLPYCSGDTWTGNRSEPTKPFGFNFAGHRILEATFAHLNATAGLTSATRALVTGWSAGGIGTFNNADFASERWLAHVNEVRAAPVSGFYFPGAVELYPLFALGVHVPVNNLASAWLTSWFESALDESCVSQAKQGETHRCWDASYNYPHIKTRLFVIENRFDANQIKDVLLCPKCGNGKNASDKFIKAFGEIMKQGLTETVQSDAAVAKGDALFSPSCLEHTSNICVMNGPSLGNVRVRDRLPDWFEAQDTSNATVYQIVDPCESQSDMPCNQYCQC